MANGILVLVEHQDGRPKKTAFELLTKALELGVGPVMAAVVGAPGLDVTATLASYGAAKVFYALDADLAQPAGLKWARAVESVVRAADPAAVLAVTSMMSKDNLPRVAARFNAGLASDCIALTAAGGKIVARRPVYSGKAIVDVEIPEGIQFFTVRPNSFSVAGADASRSAEVVTVPVAFADGDGRVKVVEVTKAASTRVDLTEADRIVSAGRSIGSAANFALVEKLADAIGASVGASRAAVDAGYAGHDMQVGQTGKTVNPTLYIALGISGAIQHVAGMRSSKVIVAVNKDPEAPIFQIADYGVVGDLFEAAPLMEAELRKIIG